MFHLCRPGLHCHGNWTSNKTKTRTRLRTESHILASSPTSPDLAWSNWLDRADPSIRQWQLENILVLSARSSPLLAKNLVMFANHGTCEYTSQWEQQHKEDSSLHTWLNLRTEQKNVFEKQNKQNNIAKVLVLKEVEDLPVEVFIEVSFMILSYGTFQNLRKLLWTNVVLF